MLVVLGIVFVVSLVLVVGLVVVTGLVIRRVGTTVREIC